MATALKGTADRHISEKEYLAGEQASEIKHEYVDGQVYAMGGGTDDHGRISRNFLVAVSIHLKDHECEPFPADVLVKASETKFRYPDVMVVCNETSKSNLYKECPVIIVEVLSSSTRKLDKTTKMVEYLNIPTLQEYVLIEQNCVDVEVLRRDNGWKSEHYFLGDEVTFESIGFTMSVEEIYERVQNEEMIAFLNAKEEEQKQGNWQ
jgi:Uma2 family endonuclease